MDHVYLFLAKPSCKNSQKQQLKAKQTKHRYTWPLSSQKQVHDVKLANRKARGVCFLFGFSVYLFLAQNGPYIPVLS